jgi:hypothetical protein
MNDLTVRTAPELLVDARGHALRATWHPDDREVVLGVWDDRRCVGTVRLDPPAAARLGAFLMASLGAAVESPAPAVGDGGDSWTHLSWTELSWTDRWQRLRDAWLARLNR